jgi:ubiquinone/menaquinone biosynthesis C-methylase UbiE
MSHLFSKSHKGVGMNGPIATWYAKNTGQGVHLREYAAFAKRLSAYLKPGSRVLEIAFGPGYGAIELSRLGDYAISGVDISDTFVRIAGEKARAAGVRVDFRQGDAQALPFEAETFDLTYCHAAFKNFTKPVKAIEEMHRVLRPGGIAVIGDLRPGLSDAAIADYTRKMDLGAMDAFFTRMAFKHMLTRLAHTREEFQEMAAASPFKTCEIRETDVSYEVILRRTPAA